jgi:hypothetical protein
MAGHPPHPRFLQPEPDQPEPIDQHLSEVTEACQHVAAGEWDLDQFADYIEQLAERLAEREEFIKSMPIPPEIIDEIREELELGFSGITYWNDGVARLAQFPDDPDVEHLEEGLELCRQGNDLLNEAAQLNRANYKRVEQLYRESSAMS